MSNIMISNVVTDTLSKEQNSKMEICLEHYDYINKCIEKLEEAILALVVKYRNEINLLLTINVQLLQLLECYLLVHIICYLKMSHLT